MTSRKKRPATPTSLPMTHHQQQGHLAGIDIRADKLVPCVRGLSRPCIRYEGRPGGTAGRPVAPTVFTPYSHSYLFPWKSRSETGSSSCALRPRSRGGARCVD